MTPSIHRAMMTFTTTWLCTLAALANGPPAASMSSRPSTRPSPAEIDALVRRLGATNYADRESAQAALESMIDEAADVLIARVTDADPEIANRVELVLTEARGAELRARIAVGLIETGQSELIARATWMVFEDGAAALSPFRAAAARGGPRVQAAAPIILGELESFVYYEKSALLLMEKTREKQPEISIQQPRNIEEQRRGLCYYAAYEAGIAAGRWKPPSSRSYLSESQRMTEPGRITEPRPRITEPRP